MSRDDRLIRVLSSEYVIKYLLGWQTKAAKNKDACYEDISQRSYWEGYYDALTRVIKHLKSL